MQSIIKNIILITIICLLTGCSKDFLTDNLTQVSTPLGLSNIYISPDWDNSNFIFKLPKIKKANYEITSKPLWLNISSLKGILSDSIALVQCSATRNSDFSSAGIYMDFMTIAAENKEYKVPVAYINEGFPNLEVQNSLNFYDNTLSNPNLLIKNTGLGVLVWEIKSMPDWLVIDTSKLTSNGLYLSPYTAYNIPFKLKASEFYSGIMTGRIILTSNDNEHPIENINVSINFGDPRLGISTNTIDFSFTEITKQLNFNNFGTGNLIWQFKNIPDWLTITPSSGVYSNVFLPNNDIIFTCNRNKLSPGLNTAEINLITNDKANSSYNIIVTAFATGINKTIRAFDGTVIDAIFNKNSNILYYITSSPNKLISYDVINKTVLDEIALSYKPTCLAISEEWTEASIGHNGYISAINLLNKKVTATYTIDYSVYDIAWAENNWFCYTQNGGNSSVLHWINTANGSLYDNTDSNLDNNSIIKKVPNKPFLIASRNSTSPSGFISYNITSKSIQSYSHMDLYNFWFSQNGEYIFAKDLKVYRTTSSTGSTNTSNADINSINKIITGNVDNYGLQSIDQSNNYLWVIQNNSYYPETSSSIYQLEDNDYTLVKKITYDTIYQPNKETSPFNVSAKFVFANKESSEIIVLSKGIDNNSWIMQFVSVK